MEKVAFELDSECHGQLCREAERLGVSPEEIARRAVAAWLHEMVDEGGDGGRNGGA